MNASESETPKTEPKVPTQPPAKDGSMRDTIESIVFAFVLAFTFRAFVVEAFVIPTGSMAPTLLGQHLKAQCPQCGYRFQVGPDKSDSNATEALNTHCPMCRMTLREPDNRPVSSGDRILVLKYIYAFKEPQRWDVVVFKNPQRPNNGQADLQNYIKRLVGLPNEELKIVRGNVYRRDLIPATAEDGTAYMRPPSLTDPADAQRWQIVRKTNRPKIQRAIFQPIYHSDFVPLDGGQIGGDREFSWTMPWQALEASTFAKDQRLGTWQYLGGEQPGTIQFNFESDEVENPYDHPQSARSHTRFNYYTYNKQAAIASNASGPNDSDGFEDTRVSATFVPEAEGLGVNLSTASPDLLVRGVIGTDGKVQLQVAERAELGTAEWVNVGDGNATVKLAARQPVRVELWHVDQEISLWVDGQRVDHFAYPLEWLYRKKITDLTPPAAPLESMHHYRPGPVMPVVSVSATGPATRIRSVNLDRDLYYTHSTGGLGTSRNAIIGPDQFFCLGDNSPASLDSRGWTDIDQWVRDLTDRKNYVHLEGDRPVTGLGFGLVPRELMIGRAFFVYWPAAHRVHHTWSGTIPNFGDMRFIR